MEWESPQTHAHALKHMITYSQTPENSNFHTHAWILIKITKKERIIFFQFRTSEHLKPPSPPRPVLSGFSKPPLGGVSRTSFVNAPFWAFLKLISGCYSGWMRNDELETIFGVNYWVSILKIVTSNLTPMMCQKNQTSHYFGYDFRSRNIGVSLLVSLLLVCIPVIDPSTKAVNYLVDY